MDLVSLSYRRDNSEVGLLRSDDAIREALATESLQGRSMGPRSPSLRLHREIQMIAGGIR